MANESLIKLLKVFGLYSVVTKSEEACTPGALAAAVVLFFVETDLCVDSSCLFVRAGALLSIFSLSVFLFVLKAFLIVF